MSKETRVSILRLLKSNAISQKNTKKAWRRTYILFEKSIQRHIKNTLRQLRKTANTYLNTSYNSCKRTQNCWPTIPNIVRCYMLRSFAYPVACCCVLLGGCYIRLYTTNNKQLAAN